MSIWQEVRAFVFLLTWSLKSSVLVRIAFDIMWSKYTVIVGSNGAESVTASQVNFVVFL